MSGEREAECTKLEDGWWLFVGGPLDGQLIEIQGKPMRYEHRMEIDGQAVVHEYVLQPVEVERRFVTHFYCHTGMGIIEAVLRMMAAYAVMKL